MSSNTSNRDNGNNAALFTPSPLPETIICPALLF